MHLGWLLPDCTSWKSSIPLLSYHTPVYTFNHLPETTFVLVTQMFVIFLKGGVISLTGHYIPHRGPSKLPWYNYVLKKHVLNQINNLKIPQANSLVDMIRKQLIFFSNKSLELMLRDSQGWKVGAKKVCEEMHGIEIKHAWTLVSALSLSSNVICDKIYRISELQFSISPTDDRVILVNAKTSSSESYHSMISI